jgi:DNA-binding GntR family transcriptional regulator
VEAIRAGDEQEAAARMSRHLESTMASVRALRVNVDRKRPYAEMRGR